MKVSSNSYSRCRGVSKFSKACSKVTPFKSTVATALTLGSMIIFCSTSWESANKTFRMSTPSCGHGKAKAFLLLLFQIEIGLNLGDRVRKIILFGFRFCKRDIDCPPLWYFGCKFCWRFFFRVPECSTGNQNKARNQNSQGSINQCFLKWHNYYKFKQITSNHNTTRKRISLMKSECFCGFGVSILL